MDHLPAERMRLIPWPGRYIASYSALQTWAIFWEHQKSCLYPVQNHCSRLQDFISIPLVSFGQTDLSPKAFPDFESDGTEALR
jgi:hypothetical protein